MHGSRSFTVFAGNCRAVFFFEAFFTYVDCCGSQVPKNVFCPSIDHTRWAKVYLFLFYFLILNFFILLKYSWFRASLVAQMVKNLPAMRRPGFDPWVRNIPWSRKRQPTPISLPREFHGQRSLAGYSPYGRKESDTIDRLTCWLS